MIKTTLLLAATILAFGLSACSDKSSETPITVKTQNLPTIDMVATHAIDLDISVAQLTFVPNSVAPWLGRIILLDDDGHLYSTDIEGRAPKPVGTGKYIDIFGLAREAAPGVFLAITEDNQIEAFIESDDDGNFSPMIYSGESLSAIAILKTNEPNKMVAKIVAEDDLIHTLNLAINKNILQLETTKIAKSLVYNEIENRNDVIVISNSGKDGVVLDIQDGSKLAITTVTAIVVKEYKADIKNGLSVRGTQHIKYVTSTQSNYGGGAYADGVLALVDKDENRIVFISLDYARRKIFDVTSPPEGATAETPQ